MYIINDMPLRFLFSPNLLPFCFIRWGMQLSEGSLPFHSMTAFINYTAIFFGLGDIFYNLIHIKSNL